MGKNFLTVRVNERICALDVEYVEETMRPPGFEALPDLPVFVRGISIIRSQPTPIVDLRILLGDGDGEAPRRLVTVRTARDRLVGLLVDEVLRVRGEEALTASELPPLIQRSAAETIEALAMLDDGLATVLRTGHVVPPRVWEQLHGAGRSR